MRVDPELLKEVRKANGDGSRAAKFAFLEKVEAVKRELSCPEVMQNFSQCFRRHSRAAIAACLAATIMQRCKRLEARTVEWAMEVMECWTTRPGNMGMAVIDDGLHPSRIEEYAGSFLRITSVSE